jgi:beta-lactamase class D
VEKGGRVYPFAINLSLQKPEDAGKRVELGRACLEALEIL